MKNKLMLSKLQKLCYDDILAKVNERIPIPSFTIIDTDWSERIHQKLINEAREGKSVTELTIIEHTSNVDGFGQEEIYNGNLLPKEFVKWWHSTFDSYNHRRLSFRDQLYYELIGRRRDLITEKYIKAMKDHWETKSDVKIEFEFGVPTNYYGGKSTGLKWIIGFIWINPIKEKALESARKKIKL
jgi:hypothetical protein